MKSGYKRLLIFELFIIAILILNSFVSSILRDYVMVAFILIILILFKFLFGFEKDRHRYIKDIIYETTIFLLIFFLLYYSSGIIFEYARTGNYYTLKNMFKFVVPIILLIFPKEFLRYMMLKKGEGSKLLFITTCILFIFIDISVPIYYNTFNSGYEVFILFALTILPSISKNVACSYVTKTSGYKPVIYYLLITELYAYLLPIVPDPNQYIVSIILFLLPILYALCIYRFYKKDEDEEVEREYNKKKNYMLIFPTCLVIFLVYITSGYFHFHAITIASGSMSPNIKKGDVVVIEKLNNNYNGLQVGEVIAYKYHDIVIVHRLVDVLNVEDKYYFYTKGDANSKADNYVITEDMIIGKVNVKVPYIGLPTVWLHGLWED